ncbi:MAG: aminodeoxychorismate/anthranilate synthase component II [Parasphingopyxis sp.]
MIFLLDNYDSFTWNLVHYLRQLGAEVRVARNDELSAADAIATGAEGFVISPGPGRPEAAGISLDLVAACVAAERPLLGVCLGHQAIGMHFGAAIERCAPVHGKIIKVAHNGSGIFAGLPSPFGATRYNSLTVAATPEALIVNSTAEDDTIMGLRHPELPIHGVQFHPESIASEHGHRLLANFIRLTGDAVSSAA